MGDPGKFNPSEVVARENHGSVTETHVKIDNESLRQEANFHLEQAAETLSKHVPGFRHIGSVAMHFYASPLVADAQIIFQMPLGAVPEQLAAIAHNKLFHKFMDFYGKKFSKRKR